MKKTILFTALISIVLVPHIVFAGGGPAIDVAVPTSAEVGSAAQMQTETAAASVNAGQKEQNQALDATRDHNRSATAASMQEFRSDAVLVGKSLFGVGVVFTVPFVAFVVYRFRRKNSEINHLLGIDVDIDKSQKND